MQHLTQYDGVLTSHRHAESGVLLIRPRLARRAQRGRRRVSMPNKAAAFNISLSTQACPRCRSVGLVEIDEAVFCGAPTRDKHLAWPPSDPALYARCERCHLVLGVSPEPATGVSDHWHV